jgi:hypothetical protein
MSKTGGTQVIDTVHDVTSSGFVAGSRFEDAGRSIEATNNAAHANQATITLSLPAGQEARSVALDWLRNEAELDLSNQNIVADHFVEVVKTSIALRNRCPSAVSSFASLLETLVVRNKNTIEFIEEEKTHAGSK